MTTPIIAIIGRPNVGKSTLFNRLSERKKVIVIDEPGATRDRNYTETSWNGKTFILIDTGGFEPMSDERLLVQMREQTTLAIEEADRIIFLLDGREGLTPSDEDIAKRLRKTGKDVFFTVNKIDGPKGEILAHEFHRLGVDRLFTISAQHGLGVGELMDAVTDGWPVSPVSEDEVPGTDDRIRIAVIGRPNVGKSSLVNKILGYERTIVNPVPGTTRDTIDTPFDLLGRKYLLIDTAGIRRKSRISLKLEKYSVIEVLKVIGRCDAALILIDAEEGVTDQDARIAGLAYEGGVLCILVINKWDLLKKDDRTLGRYVKEVKDSLKFLDFAPIVFVSALTGQRVPVIFDAVEKAYAQYTSRVSTSELNIRVREIMATKPPPRHRNRPNTFGYVTQTSVKPPTFVFFVREPGAVHFSYQRYLANRLRETFGFEQVPIRLIFRRKSR